MSIYKKYQSDFLYITDGIDFDKRRIYFDVDVSEDSVGAFIRAMQKMIDSSPHQPIELYINTSGGSLSASLSFYDFIRSCPSPVHASATGSVMSAGMIMLLACDRRSASPNTRFMDHALSLGVGGSDENVMSNAKEGIVLGKMVLQIYADRTNLTKIQWKNKFKGKDYFFDVKKALEYGVLDGTTWKPRD